MLLDTNKKEILEFDITIVGLRDPSQALYRLFIRVSDDYHIGLSGKYEDGVITFMIPPLKDLCNIQDNQEVPYHIELVADELFQNIYQSELELFCSPEIKITKATQLKKEVKESKPIKIEQKQIFKEKSDFAKSFNAFVELRKQGE